MDKVGIMAALCVRVCVCSSLYMKALYMSAFIYSELHTRTTGHNMLP